MSSSDLTPEEFWDEYQLFVKMGLSPYEIARSFGMSLENVEARLRRFKRKNQAS